MLKPGILACREPQLCRKDAARYPINVSANYLVPMARTFLVFEAVSLKAELCVSTDRIANRVGERGIRANSGYAL
jgi:hypothetical protein